MSLFFWFLCQNKAKIVRRLAPITQMGRFLLISEHKMLIDNQRI
jgi:hypothetical protein